MAEQQKKSITDIGMLTDKIKSYYEKNDGELQVLSSRREYELFITDLVKETEFTETLIADIEKQIDDKDKTNPTADDKLDFALFFVLFTYRRRSNHGDLLDYYIKHEGRFGELKIMVHIKALVDLCTGTDARTLYRAIKSLYYLISDTQSSNKAPKIPKLPKKSGKNRSDEELQGDDTVDFSTHVGVLNNYVDLVCTYCELRFDERDDKEIVEMLDTAFKYNKYTIESEEREHPDKPAYNKFYLNKGRLLVLLKRYDEGEKQIKYAISLIPASQDRAMVVNNYSQYLAKSSMIRSFDVQSEKFEHLDKFKSDSYKSISLIMALLGFLLGTINIFAKVTDTRVLFWLMLGYCGLVLMLAGVVLIGFALNFGESKKRFWALNITLTVVGISLFVTALTFAW